MYATSKLANILFTRALAQRLAGSKVTANCLHPGVIGSEFAQDEPGLLKTLMKIAKPILMSPEDGAKTSIYLASSPDVATVSGEYFLACKPKQPSRRARNDDDAERLWQRSESWMP